MSERSAFVTAFAWLGLVVSGFAIVVMTVHGLQDLMVYGLPGSGPEPSGGWTLYPPLAAAPPPGEQLPWLARLFTQHTLFVLAGCIAIAAFVFVSSLGLLRRRRWGRRAALVSLGIVVATSIAFARWCYELTVGMPGPAAPVVAFGGACVLATTLVCAWIARRLGRDDVRHEFGDA